MSLCKQSRFRTCYSTPGMQSLALALSSLQIATLSSIQNLAWSCEATNAFFANLLANLASAAIVSAFSLLLSRRPTRNELPRVLDNCDSHGLSNREMRLLVYMSKYMRVLEIVPNDPRPPYLGNSFSLPSWITESTVRTRCVLKSLEHKGLCTKVNGEYTRRGSEAFSLNAEGEQAAIASEDTWRFAALEWLRRTQIAPWGDYFFYFLVALGVLIVLFILANQPPTHGRSIVSPRPATSTEVGTSSNDYW